MYTPYDYNKITELNGRYKPNMIKYYNTQAFDFWCRSLFQRASSAIILNVPDNWRGKVKDFLKYCLFRAGYVVVSSNEKYGEFFQPCTIGGKDFYYQPTKAIVANPQYEATLYLGYQGELLKLTPDYMGIWDIIEYYAEKLAVLDPALNISMINSKFAWFLGARNKTAAEALKKGFDKINSGEPMAVFDKKLINDPTDKMEPWQLIDFGNLKERYITDKILTDAMTILNQFDAEIGIPTVPYQKKERMVTSEAESREMDSTSRCQVWVDTLNESIFEIKRLYPYIKLSAEMRYKPDREVSNNGEDNIDRLE